MRSTIRENDQPDEGWPTEPPHDFLDDQPGPAPVENPAAYADPRPSRDEGRSATSNVASERIALGAMMQSVDAIGDIIEIVRSDEFYSPKHSTIFNAITGLYGDGDATDPVSVGQRLLASGDLMRVGGVPYLHDCMTAVPIAANGAYHARKVAELAVRRRILQAGTLAAQAATNPTYDVDKVTNLAETAIYDATMRRESQDLTPIGASLPATLEAIRVAAESRDGMRGITTGFRDLDRLTSGLRGGQFIVIAGRPGQGKSTFAVDISRANAIAKSLPVGIISLEMAKDEINTRILSAESKVPLHVLTNGTATSDDWDKLHQAAARISPAPLRIDDSPGATLTEIRSKARRMKQRHGLHLLVVDYLQLLTPGARKTDSRQQEVADMSRGLKLLSKELDVPVIAVAQLNRNSEMRSDKRPQLSDLRESGALEQDADIVIMVHREDYYDKESPRVGEADLIVVKHRGGPTDTITVSAQLHRARFVDFAEV
jgi:replicative DNA helicase